MRSRLTAPGRDAFERWLWTPVTHGRQMRIEFLAKLYFAQRQGAASTARLIDQQTAACQAWLQDLRMANTLVAEAEPQLEAEQVFFGYAVQQFHLNQIESFIAWLATCRVAILLAAACEE